jgi:hypothetical protein
MIYLDAGIVMRLVEGTVAIRAPFDELLATAMAPFFAYLPESRHANARRIAPGPGTVPSASIIRTRKIWPIQDRKVS